jgi:TolB-like protein/AraC-like DNA-binding protein
MKEENQPSIDDQFLQLIFQEIEENLENENYSVEKLANKVGLSRSMMFRKLIKLTGKSANELITEKRLQRAKKLLEDNVCTASEVAYRVGFNSPSYFTKVFKKYFMVSPGDFRRSFPHGKDLVNPEKVIDEKSPWKLRWNYWMLPVIVLILIAFAIVGKYWLFKPDKTTTNSIAILPFDNIGTDEKTQYFADGIVEDLLNRLSQIEGLKIISRTSSEVFREKGHKTIPEIARILGVRYILEGTVQKEADNVRITIQLIDAKKDDHILSKQYNRSLKEVFDIQSEIASQIVSELSFVLDDKQLKALNRNQTKNIKAFEFYQLGRFHSSKRWIDAYKISNDYYQKAIEEDPDYAIAYAGLSDNYHLMALQKWINKTEGKTKAIELATKAIKLDPSLSEPHAVLGDLYTYTEYNWERADRELTQAIKLNPNNSTALQYYSELMAILGRKEMAREYINKAIELNPFSFVIRFFSSLYYFHEEDYSNALAEIKICQDLVKDHEWAISLEFRIQMMLKNEPAAFDCFRKLGSTYGEWTNEEADSVYKADGIKGIIRWRLMEKRWVYEDEKIAYYLMLGENKNALEILKSSLINFDLDPLDVNSPEYKNLYSYPEYNSIRIKMGLKPL